MRWLGVSDARRWLIALAFFCSIATFVVPQLELSAKVYDLLAVIDLTGSMNVADYGDSNKPVSRLEASKSALRRLVTDLPCGSRLGLAIFTERRTFLLAAPMEVCANFAPLKRMIADIDWRMAWAGDSYITKGVHHAIAESERLHANVLFLTDGQEAPPLHHSGMPPFEGEVGKVNGVLVGVGQYAKSPIPKFDRDGRRIGFYAVDDVPHENRHGLPPKDSMTRQGFHPRNAPWGGAAPAGDEHLSAVREKHLKAVGAQTGLGYVHLKSAASVRDVLSAIGAFAKARTVQTATDIRGWLAGVAILSLLGAFLLLPLFDGFARWRLKQRSIHQT